MLRCSLPTLLLCFCALNASPKGFKPIAGDAKIVFSENGKMHIETKNSTIIHWDEFSIQAGERVHFSQTEGARGVLNRVQGGKMSAILGALTSNGHVFLINPNGILIGAGATIDTKSFLASTSDVLDEAFLRGKDLLFLHPGDGKITNLGTITARDGDCILIARTLENQGTLLAPQGTVGFASAEEVLLKPDGPDRIFIRPETKQTDGTIDQKGVIEALAIEIKASGAHATAIRSSGKISANTLKNEQGRIYLVAHNGKTEAGGSLIADSGTIHILADDVTIKSDAVIDVSGNTQGGTCLIGGDKQGKNPSILNAKTCHVEDGAQINADSRVMGDAGQIIIWSDGDTYVGAKISAQALGLSGNGGFLELSGKNTIALHPNIIHSVGSNYGTGGTILLDPGTINISSVASSITSGLLTGNYVVSTADGTSGPETINVDTNITWASPYTLTLTAGRDVVFYSGNYLECTGAGSVVVESSGNGDGNYSGVLFYGTGAGLKTNTGNISVTGVGGNDTGAFDNSGIFTYAGTVFQSTSGHIELMGTARPPITSPTAPNLGIHIYTTSITTGSNGNITLTGVAQGNQSGTNGRDGIALQFTPVITWANGTLTLNGTGGNAIGGVDNCTGVTIDNVTFTCTGTGSAVITGVAGNTSGNGIGVNCFNSTPINLSGGNITIIGTANGNSTNEHGVFLASPLSTNGNGTISVTGTASPTATGTSRGILLNTGANISTVNGDITLTGTGNGTGTNAQGLLLQGTVQPTGSGSVHLTGTGATSVTTNGAGVEFNPAIALNLTGGGSVDITGEGAQGIVGLTSLSTTGAGSILLDSTSSALSLSTPGFVSNTPFSAATNQGSLTIKGRSQSSGNGSSGLDFVGGTFTTATGDFTLVGIGSVNGGTNSPGINLGGALILNIGGHISLNGTGGGIGGGNEGIVTAIPIAVTGMNDLTLSGISSPNIASSAGITIAAPQNFSTQDGNLHITGISQSTGPDCPGISILGGTITTTGTGTLILTGIGSPSGTTGAHGVIVNGTPVATAGAINITGVGGGTDGSNCGILITNGATLEVTDGTSMLTGTGGPVGPDSFGVSITGATTELTIHGNLVLTGHHAGNTEDGVHIFNGGKLTVLGETAALSALSDFIIENGGVVDLSAVTNATISADRDLIIRAETAQAQLIGASNTTTALAGRDILISSSTTLPFTATVTTNGNLIFVADNNFPTSPELGNGRLHFSQNSLIQSLGELRLYSSDPTLNTLSAPLNGQLLFTNTLHSNTYNETFNTYYPQGPYTPSQPFHAYYKTDGFVSTKIVRFMAVNAQLSDYLPVIKFLPNGMPDIVTSAYSGNILNTRCDQNLKLNPYGAFIFEDRLYWITECEDQ